MEDVFYSKHPRKLSNRLPGHIALIIRRPPPVYATDGTVFFYVRFAIRVARSYTNTNRSKHNRLAVKRFRSTYYDVERFEYRLVKWGSTSEDPVMLNEHGPGKYGAVMLKEALLEYERS